MLVPSMEDTWSNLPQVENTSEAAVDGTIVAVLALPYCYSKVIK